MLRYLPIRKVHGRQVLDSRGNPTVEVEVTVGEGVIGINGITARAIVPSGASKGKFEAMELRDNKKEYNGKSVKTAINNINTLIADHIVGENALNQVHIDNILIELDGTQDKSKLGANAILGVSLAIAKAASQALRIPLFQYIGGIHTRKMPIPMMNILNGGVHASNTIDFQEFMIMPIGAEDFENGIQMCTEIYHSLKNILLKQNMSIGVGDEGGFAPNIENTEKVLEILLYAIEKSGYEPGKDIFLSIDAASSELYDEEKNVYYFPGESTITGNSVYRDTNEMIDYYDMLISKYPIISIEDGLAEDDWDGWIKMTERLGKGIQLVGDDLFVTNKSRLKCGIKLNAANAILVKLNQIGTVSEAIDTVKTAYRAGYNTIISHRSGDSEDTFIADFAVAMESGQIKTGAPCRSERNAKYNQLLRISDLMKENATYETAFERYNS